MRANRWMSAALVLLGIGIAVSAVLGPLVAGVLVYRTSATGLNQIAGGDLAALLVAAPASIVVAMLAWRRHPAAPVLALAPATYALYLYAQLVVGQEYLALPGNSEHFFLLHLAVFLLAETALVLALAQTRAIALPPVARRDERIAAAGLLFIALFLVVGLHGPGLVDALGPDPRSVEYLTSPAAFWAVKLMDLGIVVPAAVTTAVGLLRRATWASKAMYAIAGGYTLLSSSVAGMAIVMFAGDDPNGSLGLTLGFTTVSIGLAAFAVHLVRPLLATGRSAGPASQGPGAAEQQQRHRSDGDRKARTSPIGTAGRRAARRPRTVPSR